MNRVAIAAFLVFPVTAAAPAAAGPPCASRDTMVDYLAETFAEAPVAMGLANNGGMIEVLTDERGRTFSIVITMPDGETCLIAAGRSWEPLPAPAAGPPDGEPAA